jgi:hypothetical protein
MLLSLIKSLVNNLSSFPPYASDMEILSDRGLIRKYDWQPVCIRDLFLSESDSSRFRVVSHESLWSAIIIMVAFVMTNLSGGLSRYSS